MVVGHRVMPDCELATGGVDSLSGSFLCVAGIHRAYNSCTAVLLVHDVDLVIGPDSTLIQTFLRLKPLGIDVTIFTNRPRVFVVIGTANRQLALWKFIGSF
jgi:hypothetical protein